jgi:hypothetical protein
MQGLLPSDLLWSVVWEEKPFKEAAEDAAAEADFDAATAALPSTQAWAQGWPAPGAAGAIPAPRTARGYTKWGDQRAVGFAIAAADVRTWLARGGWWTFADTQVPP